MALPWLSCLMLTHREGVVFKRCKEKNGKKEMKRKGDKRGVRYRQKVAERYRDMRTMGSNGTRERIERQRMRKTRNGDGEWGRVMEE